MRAWLAVLPLTLAACATLSGLDELGVCDGSACVDAPNTIDANDAPVTNDATPDVDNKKDAGSGGDGDASEADAPLTLTCGTSTCVLDGGTSCCVVEGGAPFCWDFPDCVGFVLACTGKAQCPGEVCCATNVDVMQGQANCAASCGTTHPVQLCNPNDPPPVCVGNKTCGKLTNGPMANVFYACL